MADQRVTDIVPGSGGVMTEEVGVVTGELTLRTELDEALAVVLRVQYKDADEWYVVTGGRTQLRDVADLDAVHNAALAVIRRGAPEGLTPADLAVSAAPPGP
jgi:hypothetical protein